MDLNLDFNHLYYKRSKPQHSSKSSGKKKKKPVKRRKKKKRTKQWDDSLSNLNDYKLDPSKQLEKKLGVVSRHRHYAKDLVQEQKRKHSEKRRLQQEEKEIENEQKQLIRRKQLLLRKHTVPNLKRTFPVFTAGRNDYDDTESEDSISQTDESDNDYDYGYNNEENMNISPDKTEMTLQALSDKLSSLENELETMKLNTNKNSDEDDNEVIRDMDTNTAGGIKLNMERINNTLNAVKEKKTAKTLDIKLPEMPNITSININRDICQPPQLIEQAIKNKEELISKLMPKDQTTKTSKTTNSTLNSLDVPSVMMLLDKLKIYFKEIQNEKKQNEEFRSTLLESVNAQNTQILHLLAQLASQQKEIDTLKNTVTSLTDKLNQVDENNINKNNNSEPKWSEYISNKVTMNKMNEIALADIKNVIEESRPNKYKTRTMLKNTDWKSISNVLPPKNDCFEHNPITQQPYTIQKHQKHQNQRSFLPQTIKQPQEQIQRITPPQPVPKEIKKKQNSKYIKANIQNNNNNFVEIDHNMQCSYPRIRVERFHK